jgi:4-coumarate--CoA ligase
VTGYKRVRQVEFTDSIPRSPAGKILRRLLVEQEAIASSEVGSGDHGHGN